MESSEGVTWAALKAILGFDLFLFLFLFFFKYDLGAAEKLSSLFWEGS